MSSCVRLLMTIALSSVLCGIGTSQDQITTPFNFSTTEAKAQQGDINAMTKLGEAYWGKLGIPADYNKGKMWLERAAEAGSVEARMFLGAAYMSGYGLPKNDELSFKYLLEVADAPNPDSPTVDSTVRGTQALAQYWISLKYEHGWGTEKSHAKAIQFLQEAANNGNYPAQFDLGMLYNDGSIGLPMDKALACQWFEKAADQGHNIAMHNTGYCYQIGTRGKIDIDKAIHYYRLAAESGLTISQHNLGMLYGTLGNAEKAHFWLRIAQSNGYAEDASKLDAAKACMTAPQLEQQNTEITTWLNEHKAKTAVKPVP